MTPLTFCEVTERVKRHAPPSHIGPAASPPSCTVTVAFGPPSLAGGPKATGTVQEGGLAGPSLHSSLNQRLFSSIPDPVCSLRLMIRKSD